MAHSARSPCTKVGATHRCRERSQRVPLSAVFGIGHHGLGLARFEAEGFGHLGEFTAICVASSVRWVGISGWVSGNWFTASTRPAGTSTTASVVRLKAALYNFDAITPALSAGLGGRCEIALARGIHAEDLAAQRLPGLWVAHVLQKAGVLDRDVLRPSLQIIQAVGEQQDRHGRVQRLGQQRLALRDQRHALRQPRPRAPIGQRTLTQLERRGGGHGGGRRRGRGNGLSGAGGEEQHARGRRPMARIWNEATEPYKYRYAHLPPIILHALRRVFTVLLLDLDLALVLRSLFAALEQFAGGGRGLRRRRLAAALRRRCGAMVGVRADEAAGVAEWRLRRRAPLGPHQLRHASARFARPARLAQLRRHAQTTCAGSP